MEAERPKPRRSRRGSVSLHSLSTGRLAANLKQSSRSALVRIVNLTKQDLVLDHGADDEVVRAHSSTSAGTRKSWVARSDIEEEQCRGFWIARPAERIPSMRAHDLGSTSHGLVFGIRGELTYVLASPHSSEEERVAVQISWKSPWLGSGRVEASDRAQLFSIGVQCDGLQNLVGSVHIIDVRALPRLEIVEATALVRAASGNNLTTSSAQAQPSVNLTHLVRSKMLSEHELRIASVRAFLSSTAVAGSFTGASPSATEAHVGLLVVYRIGPEVFRRAFKPNECVHLSTAVPGGDGHDATVLAAADYEQCDAQRSAGHSVDTERQVKLGRPQRMVLLQRTLCTSLSPRVCTAMQKTYGKDWWKPEAAATLGLKMLGCMWPVAEVGSDPCGEDVGLDAVGLLAVLRFFWPRLAEVAAYDPEKLLPPLEALATAWAEQADLDEASIGSATVSAGTLLSAFGEEEAVATVQNCCLRKHTLRKSMARDLKQGGGMSTPADPRMRTTSY